MAASVYVKPTTEPVSLGEARAHLRLDTTDTDPTLAGYIVAARQWCEAYTRRLFLAQTWDCTFDGFDDKLVLPFAPVSSISSVKYVDPDGVTQTLATSEYLFRGAGAENLPYICLAYDKTWPDVQDIPESVTVRFVGGYGTSLGDVPEPIRMAILLMVEILYDRNPQSKSLLEDARNSLLDPYRIL